MYAESEEGEPRFEPDWKAIFERDFCEVCKHRKCCPYNWVCHDMKVFIEENKEYHNVKDLDNDDTNNGDL